MFIHGRPFMRSTGREMMFLMILMTILAENLNRGRGALRSGGGAAGGPGARSPSAPLA